MDKYAYTGAIASTHKEKGIDIAVARNSLSLQVLVWDLKLARTGDAYRIFSS